MRDSDAPAARDRPLDLGVFGRTPGRGGAGAVELVALVLSLVWVAGVAWWFLAPGWQPSEQAAGLVVAALAVALPLGLLWLAALTARHLRALREEAAQLRAMLDSLRQAQIAQTQQAASVPRAIAAAAAALQQGGLGPGGAGAPAPDGAAVRGAVPARGLVAEAAAEAGTAGARAPAREAEAAPAEEIRPAFASRREAARAAPPAASAAAPQPAEEQPALALGTPPGERSAPVPAAEFIRALNFPDSPEDAEGFRALRRALEDREVARLIRAAQDILTLLSQDGIYMDELVPDRARPELWRRFAEGERGRPIAALGGIHDREILAAVTARMRKDTVFRDAAHHFLRQFDRSFAAFARGAGDAEIAEFADTRTARAFMLIGRATGTFD